MAGNGLDLAAVAMVSEQDAAEEEMMKHVQFVRDHGPIPDDETDISAVLPTNLPLLDWTDERSRVKRKTDNSGRNADRKKRTKKSAATPSADRYSYNYWRWPPKPPLKATSAREAFATQETSLFRFSHFGNPFPLDKLKRRPTDHVDLLNDSSQIYPTVSRTLKFTTPFSSEYEYKYGSPDGFVHERPWQQRLRIFRRNRTAGSMNRNDSDGRGSPDSDSSRKSSGSVISAVYLRR
ncbi:Hypp961 [Branchiostoma lanceolatum]|uniref:Hypp961 protein n=1 Tax=Branchiostoma lanceolatum TaxID=7740 RepID=A0A8J9ZER4_BRALA|nr:Hypp961 [Branchiostoma lanceolatum]